MCSFWTDVRLRISCVMDTLVGMAGITIQEMVFVCEICLIFYEKAAVCYFDFHPKLFFSLTYYRF